MAKTTTNKNNTIKPGMENSTNIEAEKKIQELEEKLAQMMKLMEQTAAIPNSVVNNANTEDTAINPNKKTKITSLRQGTMTLYAPNRNFLKFTSYGQTQIVTYAQLCDYVNACRTAAENGWFYIHDKTMVNELALTEFYDNILNSTIVDDIISGKNTEFETVITNLSEEAKETLAEIFATRVYDNKLVDLNTVDKLSRVLGINIIEKVQQMKSYAATSTQK